MDITLKDKVALVTGGGAGIGRAIVGAFPALGAEVVVLELGPDNIRVKRHRARDHGQRAGARSADGQARTSRTDADLAAGPVRQPEDHAGAAVYFATDMSAWVTGTTAPVDGGGLAASGFQRTPDGKWTIGPTSPATCSWPERTVQPAVLTRGRIAALATSSHSKRATTIIVALP